MATSETQANAGMADPGLLQRVPFLALVPTEELEELIESSLVRNYQPGQAVVKQGDFGHSMFILMHGAVGISIALEGGGHRNVATLQVSGEFFGEFALLGRGQRSATVTCEQNTVLLEIEKRRFDLLARRHGEALSTLESIYHARAISTYLRSHDFLGGLPPAELERLMHGAKMRKFARNDVVSRMGEDASTVLVVKDGVLKAARPSQDGGVSILAYFNTHDVIGVDEEESVTTQGRGYDLVALGQVEIIYLEKTQFAALATTAPEIYARFGKSSMGADMGNNQQNTVMGFAASMLKEGVEAESLLIINLDRCVRCGNCVRACHSRHEYTRLERRGPIFRRRTSLESTTHEHILVPGSCRHCRDPECMIGCPTGAIQRYPDGDVGINDNCIGCDNCARKCPYGNISMRPLPESEHKDGITKKAIKCNLCRGHSYSNCVHECPRGAILRVDPLRYFDELSTVMSAEQQAHLQFKQAVGKDESKQRIKPRTTKFITLSFVLGLAGIAAMLAFFFTSPGSHHGGSPSGLIFGFVSTGFIATALFYGARKKMRKLGKGPLEWWTQFHMVVGVLGFVAALAHAGFQLTGILTSVLLMLFGLELITGLLGQYIYMVVPTQLTRLERDGQAKLIENLLEEEIALIGSTQELLASVPSEAQGLVKSASTLAGRVSIRLKPDYDKEGLIRYIGRQSRLEEADPKLRPSLERLIKDLCALGDVRAQIRLHRRLKNWLVMHLTITGMLVVFLVVHIATMLMVLS
jgi:Fe-S-cluster-containing dehydrogenase component